MQITVVGRENGKDEADFISDEDSEADIEEEIANLEEDPNFISQKHQKHTDMESRAREDMDFPDEVDTPFKEARVKFQKYRGIKSLKDCDWDPYENLPAEYSKLFRFQNYQAAYKDSV